MTEPTDTELDAVLCKHWPAFSMQATLVRMWVRAAMRDAIAKWNTPLADQQADPKAAAGEPGYREKWDAELGRTAMRFVDRAGDVHPGIDDAETICAEFYKAMSEVIERMPHVQRMTPRKAAPGEPSDAEIDAFLDSPGGIEWVIADKRERYRLLVRAVLAKWAAPQQEPATLSRDQIREVFMAHGFTVKEGQTDLKQYVYDAAYALLGTKPAPLSGDAKDAARYRWLRDTSNADDPSHMIALHIRDEQNDASLSGIDAAIDAALAAQGDKDA